jgi:hypothetical protein
MVKIKTRGLSKPRVLNKEELENNDYSIGLGISSGWTTTDLLASIS